MESAMGIWKTPGPSCWQGKATRCWSPVETATRSVQSRAGGKRSVPARQRVRAGPCSAAGDASDSLRLSEPVEAEGTSQRWARLAPFLLGPPEYGVLGSSRFADNLRKQVVKAARDPTRRPVLVFGEPGLCKNDVAAHIHYSSPAADHPLVCVKPHQLQSVLGQPGLRQLLSKGSLLVSDAHMASADMQAQLLALAKDSCTSTNSSGPRVLFSSEQPLAALAAISILLKVPPLRVRPGDIALYAATFTKEFAARHGTPAVLTAAAVRSLESYRYPANIQELRGTVERAVLQCAHAPHGAVQLTPEVFWFATEDKQRGRINLLERFPWLRDFLRSNTWPDALNFGFTAWVYPLVLALLMWGPQDRSRNTMLNLFWAWWWPVMFLLYPFLGRIWCSVCPFMIYGELVQRLKLKMGGKLLRWPHQASEKWGPVFLLLLFGGILVWEEVYDLPHSGQLSAWLLLLITGGAMFCSAIFERRLWCRYLCPIGGMNGLFAKLSVVEVRARQGVCSGTCSTYHCFKGGPEEGEGLSTAGCPLHSHPAQLTDNRHCTLCMTCLKACPHTSVEVRLRPPGIDLSAGLHTASDWEVALMFLLLGAVFLHHVPGMSEQLHLGHLGVVGPTAVHNTIACVVLVVPGLIAAGAGALASWQYAQFQASSSQTRGFVAFVEVAYSYVPLVWAGTLAHYLPSLLRQAGLVAPVTAAMLHLDALALTLPAFQAPLEIVGFLQGVSLLTGGALSLTLLRKIGAQPWRHLVPHSAAIVLFTAELWWLLLVAQ